MKKVFALLMLVVLLLTTTLPALASRSWCATDPIIHLPDGRTLYVDVAVPEQYADRPITLYLLVPHGATVEDVDGPIHVHTVALAVLDGDENAVAAIAKTQGEYDVRLYGELDGHKLPIRKFPVNLVPAPLRGVLEYPNGAWTWKD